MKNPLLHAFACVALVLLFTGCGSVDTSVERMRSLKDIQKFFVITNLNDNHAIAAHIAAVLQSRGKEASTGPLTMMPDDAEAVVTYSDRWFWDFGDHLVFMKINVHQANSHRAFGTITYQPRVPRHESAADVITDLVDQLLTDPEKKG